MKSNFQSGNANRATAHRAMTRAARMICLSALALLFAGCRMDMHEQPKYLPYQPTTFFDDGRSERPVVPDLMKCDIGAQGLKVGSLIRTTVSFMVIMTK